MKNTGNQGGDVENQGGNLAVEINLFLVLLWTRFAQCLSVFIIEFGQVNTGLKG